MSSFMLMEERKKQDIDVLKVYSPGKVHSACAVRIASSFHYVTSDTKIKHLADALTRREDILAVGVVDTKGQVLGLIERGELFNMLGRPFGRDILNKRDVIEVTRETKIYKFSKNIFSIAEELDHELAQTAVEYFLLQQKDGTFSGIFSTKDLLIYLSNITKQDISLARTLQNRLIKESSRDLSQVLQSATYSKMAKGVGGDFYYINEYAPGRWICSLCDVSGKGVAAALITSMLWGMISIADLTRGLKSFVKQLNNHIVKTFQLEKYLTGVFLDINTKTGEMVVCDMGHSFLFLFRNHKLTKLKTTAENMPVGIIPDLTPKVYRVKLKHDDIIMLLTDGIIEQENSAGEEFAFSRVADSIRANDEKDIEVIKDNILSDFTAFREGVPLHDDITYVLLKYQDIQEEECGEEG